MATRDWYSDKLTNITGMVRAYDGPFLRRLNLKAMDVDINPEIIYKAKILRARIVEIPAHLNWGIGRLQKTRSERRKSNLRVLRTIIQSILSGFILRPFMFFIFPGIFLIILSLYPLVWTVIHTINNYRNLFSENLTFDFRLSEAIGAAFRQSPHAFIVGGIALLVGFQFTSLGLMAYQQKRYFDEMFFLGSNLNRDTPSDKSKENL